MKIRIMPLLMGPIWTIDEFANNAIEIGTREFATLNFLVKSFSES